MVQSCYHSVLWPRSRSETMIILLFVTNLTWIYIYIYIYIYIQYVDIYVYLKLFPKKFEPLKYISIYVNDGVVGRF